MNECPTGKKIYYDKDDAKEAMDRLKQDGHKITGFYKCRYCKYWHLTTR